MAISFNDALKQRRDNAHRHWCLYGETGKAADDPNSARDRLLSGEIVITHVSPKFQIEPGSKVYTIGSCFARNVENALAEHNFVLPTRDIEVDPTIYVTKPHYPNTVLNKYNAHSMSTEVLRGLGQLSFPDDGLIEVASNRWYDPQTSHTNTMPREQGVALRQILNATAAEIASADVVLMTLGLTETWRDKKTGVVFNALNVAAVNTIRDRVEFFNASAQEIFETMSDAIHSLRDANPAIKIVMTVSPVPMAQTFTPMDVIVANSYSKSALRTAAQMLFKSFDCVDYYPSYEMIMHSPRAMTWIDDQIHVDGRIVTRVIREFVDKYVRSA